MALLDMAYPSNHYTFGAVVEETPMILFRKPNAQHQMFHVDHLHADKSHFQVNTKFFLSMFPIQRKLHRSRTNASRSEQYVLLIFLVIFGLSTEAKIQHIALRFLCPFQITAYFFQGTQEYI